MMLIRKPVGFHGRRTRLKRLTDDIGVQMTAIINQVNRIIGA